MKKETITSSTIRQSNQSKIYRVIYQEKQTSKQEIVNKTGISLPTITYNLDNFEKNGLIKRNKTFASTGGRKATVIACNSLVKIAIGVEIAETFINIIAIDLYGNVINKQSLDIMFENSEIYYKEVSDTIQIILKTFPKKSILGIGIAIQGLISKDGSTVTYGEILNCTGLHIDVFQKHLSFPCTFIHDAKAAAISEIWFGKQIKDAMYLSLSRNLGGAIILNNEVYEGDFLPGGLFEHMTIVDDGEPCYCGKKGCLEAYCDANVLLKDFDTLDNFFFALSKQDIVAIETWQTYLHYLSIGIHNIAMVLGCHIILGGQLSKYITNQDISYIKKQLTAISSFTKEQDSLVIANRTTEAIVIGAALPLIKDYLESI
ncbi:MAG: ROK family transcriptional regulator [Coprobacillaceae bacterium]